MAKAKVKIKESKQIKLTLSEYEAETLRFVLWVTQLGMKGRGKAASSIAGALEDAGYVIEGTQYEEDLLHGRIIRHESVDTGIYWV